MANIKTGINRVHLICYPLAAAICCLCFANACHAQRGRFDVGDRVEVERGGEWTAGTVVGGSGTRIRVRLDDDGSQPDLPANIREKRFTRNFFASDVRAARGASAAPPRTAVGVPPTAAGIGSAATMSARRNWSDQSGRFNIEASYRGMNGEKVVLQKIDGSQIEVPLAKLSSADQKYVSSQGGDADNPFAVAPTTPPTGMVSAAGLVANKANVRSIEPKSFTEWTFTPAVGAVSDANSRRPQSVRLGAIPDSDAFFEGIESVALSSSGERAIVTRKQGKVARDVHVYLELVDLSAGKSLGLAPLPKKVEVLAVDADTGRVAYRPDEFGEDNEKLHIAELRGPQLVPTATWEPYADADWGPRKETEAAWFLSGGQLMTTNAHGDSLTIWNPATAEALVEIPVSHGFGDDDLVISPDGHYAAVKMSSGIAIIDLQASEHVATIDLGKQGAHLYRHLAFKADNQMLAAIQHDGVAIWGLKSGKLLRTFDHDTLFSGDSVEWVGNFLFHRNRYVYDYQRRILLWEFAGLSSHDSASTIKNGLLCLVPKDRKSGRPTLRTFPVPSAEMLSLADQLGPPDGLIVAQAGDPVAIKLDIDERVISADEVRRTVTANLQKAGYVVANDSKLVVTAICKQLPSKTVKINTGANRFRPRPQDIVERTITPHPTSLTLTYGGTRVWRRSNMGRPGMTIWMDEGESIDQALTRLTTPNTKLLTDADFPSEIIRPGTATSNGAFGVTNLPGTHGGASF